MHGRCQWISTRAALPFLDPTILETFGSVVMVVVAVAGGVWLTHSLSEEELLVFGGQGTAPDRPYREERSCLKFQRHPQSEALAGAQPQPQP